MGKRIFYDATFQILSPHRGMAVYLNGLLDALVLSGQMVKGIAPAGIEKKSSRNVLFCGHKNILLWEQLSASQFINENNIDCFIFPYNTGPVFTTLNCKSVLILHDIIFMEPFSSIPLSKNIRQNIGRLYRRLIVPVMVKKADYIITVSEYSKQEIIKKFKINDKKVSVIPNFIELNNNITESDASIERKYFLNVGGDATHKNAFFLVNAYYKLPKEIKDMYSLKIVGVTNSSAKRKLIELIKNLKQENNIFIEEFLNAQKLEQLYLSSFLFIFPSLKEGFGIPLLEAMKYSCTIVCSNTSSMPEVCADAAFYFNPCSIESFIKAICNACNNTVLRIEKITASQNRLNYYSKDNFNKKVIKWFAENILNE